MNKHKIYAILVSFFLMTGILAAPVSEANLPEAQPDKALFVFYRLDAFKGKAIRFTINHPEGTLGQLLSGTYLYKFLDPGEHTFWSQALSQDSISINVEAGDTYFIKGDVKIGVLAGRPQFTLMSEYEALADLENAEIKTPFQEESNPVSTRYSGGPRFARLPK